MLKKVTSIVLAIIMTATAIAVNPTPASAKVIIKSGSKITLTVGKTKTIKVSQKGATFTSSNNKVATVTKKGKVTAKKPGTCKIVVKVGKNKKSVSVTVNLANATMSSATLVSTNSAKVTWGKVKGATGYYVYYSTSKTSGFKKVEVKGNSATNTTIKELSLGTTYYFKVKAYAKVGSKTYTSKSYSGVQSVRVYKLVWNDEFDGTELDTTKWNNEGATGAGGYGNSELQNYQMDYCEVKDGSLIIKPQFEYNPRTKTAVKNSYYSTKLWSKDLYSFTYGKVEFRVKLPKGQGTWAACWMLGNDSNYGSWPWCGEIDVLETTSDITKTIIPQSIHCQKYNGMSTSSGNKYKNTIVSDATSAYHTYGIIWTEKTITFTIDGQVTWTSNPNNYDAVGDGTKNANIWPFNKPFYLILNCAIGGTLGGTVTPTYWTKIGEKTYDSGSVNEIYQDYMYVDYVRVYQ
jgi:beta-glucanase (GH16 family)